MPDLTIETSADKIYETVKNRKKISLENLSIEVGMPVRAVEGLVNFFVEEQIFGIEYKFTTPYVYLKKESKEHEKNLETLSHTDGRKIEPKASPPPPEKENSEKKIFFIKARKRGLSERDINTLWARYLEKKEFYKLALSRGISEGKISELWDEYLNKK